MVNVAAIVPVRDGQPATGGPEVVAEALDLAGSVDDVRLLLIGIGTRQAAAALADAGFADVAMQCAETDTFAPGRWAVALAGCIADTEAVLLPGSNDGRDLGPRLAAVLVRPFVAGAMSIGRGEAVIPRAAGRALARITFDEPAVATLQPGVRSAERTAGPDAREPVDLAGFALIDSVADAEVIAVTQAGAETMDLAEAPFIVGVGAGLGSRDVSDGLQAVAAGLGASVGATRVVTDDGWLDHDRQIGTTGVVVDPKVYVAFGISGAVQHTAGLGAPDHVISVNIDAHCPMMGRADVAIVADAPAVVGELQRRITDETTDRTGQEPS